MHILHVPFGYFPDVRGGTEVYVKQLASELARLDCSSSIAAPGESRESYEYEGVTVHRFTAVPLNEIEPASGIQSTAAQFTQILGQSRPDVVHLHAKSPAVSIRLVEACHKANIPVVSTYHTPTAGCIRGDLNLFGETPCDGFLGRTRCTACVLQKLGAGKTLGWILAYLPLPLTKAVAKICRGKPRTMLLQPFLTAVRLESTTRFWRSVDRLIVMSQWTVDLLKRNGIGDAKFIRIPHGIPPVSSSPFNQDTRNPHRFSFFGRLSPEKGLNVFIDALEELDNEQLSLDIYGLKDDASPLLERLDRLIKEKKVNVMEPVPVEDVGPTMRSYSAVVIPSQWYETGPLVALEAIANNVPVLGSNLGGIAEIAARYGGVQLIDDYKSPSAWLSAISQPLRPSPRTTEPLPTSEEVARLHLKVYKSLVDA